MNNSEEYHDPDYPEQAQCVEEEVASLPEEDKTEKIRQILQREFSGELEARKNEVLLIDQRMMKARRYLHQIRYHLVNSYYNDPKLQLTQSQIEDDIASQSEPRAKAEVTSLLRESQPRIHPSVLKLLGKPAVDLEEIFQYRAPRNKSRKDYSAMIQTRKPYTKAVDATKTMKPEKPPDEGQVPEEPCTSKPKKIPRHIEPKIEKVVTLDKVTRNKMKHRYRIIIGNTSKYVPASSRADRSTHKWLLYVRGPPARPDLRQVLTAATVRLHATYAPHHTVRLDKPPFHISRRGWGEFPAKVELHFPLPDMNRPAVVEHTIKLDRNFTGLQTLGAETIVDVWLYSTPEMLEYEYKDDNDTHTDTQIEIPVVKEEIKEEPQSESENNDNQPETNTDSWLDFFSKDTELNVDEMLVKTEKTDMQTDFDQELYVTDSQRDYHITNGGMDSENSTQDLPKEILQSSPVKKRIMKYMDPTTGKIYYLEMDRNLDLSKVQEIVINSKGNIKTAKISPIKTNGLKGFRKKKGVSLLKPEVKSLLKSENRPNLSHIQNDHCYLGVNWPNYNFKVPIKEEISEYDNLIEAVGKMNSVRVIVNYLLKKIPIISENARDPDYLKYFPFLVDNEEKYWKLDFAKRRNIEWSRAKLINKILCNKFKSDDKVWRTKQILIYARLHGFYPVRPDIVQKPETDDWSSWNLDNSGTSESKIKELYPNSSDICSLTLFNNKDFSIENVIDVTDSDEEIDILNTDKVKSKKVVLPEDESNLEMLPVENEEDKLRFLFIERKCADFGIDLRIEDVGNGYAYSAVHAVLLSAMKSFAEELIRSSIAVSNTDETRPMWSGSRGRASVSLSQVYRATRSPRLQLVSGRALGAEDRQTTAL